MTQPHSEDSPASLLSAGADGELAREELRFLLRRLEHDAGLRDTWSRYHVIRAGLRREPAPLASAGFAARVAQALEHESAGMASTRTAGGRRAVHWLRWSAGGAIAAGVAAAALMLAQPGADPAGSRLAAETAPASDRAVARVAEPAPTTPAAVPPWLSSQTASRYSQQAAATLGESYGNTGLPYARGLSPYHLQAVRSNDHPGGYLLLIDPQMSRASSAPQASARAQ